MRLYEKLLTCLCLLLLILLPALVISQRQDKQQAAESPAPVHVAEVSHGVINIVAAAPEAGGFQPSSINVAAGETVILRFTASDVTHGIAIGPGLGIDLGSVAPGEHKEISVTFPEAGTYTFYCNIWCSPAHWRMRGILQSIDLANPNALPPVQHDPVIDRLIDTGINIDEAHLMDTTASTSHETLPAPSVERGKILIQRLSIPAQLQDSAWRQTHTVMQALDLLKTANPTASQADLIDAVAFLWTDNFSTLSPQLGEDLYTKNCLACHGWDGSGRGAMSLQTTQRPASFTDLHYLFNRRSDVLYAKIRRGGMGTDMPNFGTLFTPEETWALIDYLWELALAP